MPPKKAIVLGGVKGKKGEVKTSLLYVGELPEARITYATAELKVGREYAFVELHNLTRMSRRAHMEE